MDSSKYNLIRNKISEGDYGYIKGLLVNNLLNAEEKGKLFMQCTYPKPNMDMIKLFVENGVDVNYSSDGSNILNTIARQIDGEYVEVMDYLIKHGADPMMISDINKSAKTENRTISYHHLGSNQHTQSRTPLEIATAYGKYESVLYLREAEFKYMQNKYGQKQDDKMTMLITELQNQNSILKETIKNQTKQLDDMNKRINDLNKARNINIKADNNKRDSKKIEKMTRIIDLLINYD